MDMKGKLVINHSQDADDTVILVLSGDLDIQTAPQLRNFIDSVIREGSVNLQLDLSRLSYLDSSGYGALLDAARRTRGTAKQVNLTNLPSWMTDFFDLSVLET